MLQQIRSRYRRAAQRSGSRSLQIPCSNRVDSHSFIQAGSETLNLYALAAEAQRGIDRLAHCTTKAHALFKLQRDIFRHQLSVQLRLVHLENVDEDISIGALLEISPAASRSQRPCGRITMPGRAVRIISRSLFPGRSISTELTPGGLELALSNSSLQDAHPQSASLS